MKINAHKAGTETYQEGCKGLRKGHDQSKEAECSTETDECTQDRSHNDKDKEGEHEAKSNGRYRQRDPARCGRETSTKAEMPAQRKIKINRRLKLELDEESNKWKRT